MRPGQNYTGDKHRLIQALTHARQLGLASLASPHAAIGKMCRCGECFCCAAQAVVQAEKKEVGSSAKLL